MCELTYAGLSVGDVVLVQNHKWKRSYNSAADPALAYVWEASINTSHPCAAGESNIGLTAHLASGVASGPLPEPPPPPHAVPRRSRAPPVLDPCGDRAGRMLKLTAAEEQPLLQPPPPDADADAGGAGPSSANAPAAAPRAPRLLALPEPRPQTTGQLLSAAHTEAEAEEEAEDGTPVQDCDVLGVLLRAHPAHRVRRVPPAAAEAAGEAVGRDGRLLSSAQSCGGLGSSSLDHLMSSLFTTPVWRRR
jgi:hypothetical protein